MSDMREIVELQNGIVRCFANAIGQRWDFLLVIFEREEQGGTAESYVCELVFKQEGGKWKRDSVISPADGESMLNELARRMAKDENKTWSGCTVEIDSTEKYRFTFSREPPKYLHGALVAEPMADYVPVALS